MKKILVIFSVVVCHIGGFALQNDSEQDQFQWGIQNQLVILEKGMVFCEEHGFPFFKLQHALIKTTEGRLLSFSDICHTVPDERYEETSPLQSFLIYCFKEKPDEKGVVDVKKHQLMKKLAMQSRDSSHHKSDQTSPIKRISDESEFNELIRNGKIPTLVKCYSPDCPPCQVVTPLFEQCAQELSDFVQFLEVDLNHLPHFREAYNIEKIPTLLIYDAEGNLSERKVGLMDVAYCIDSYRESEWEKSQ